MPGRHVVVDGSNIATEGRSLPSLAQLDQAVREFLEEYPDDTVTVVVDASFAHRIDPSEVKTFEEAEAANEVVSPPAGAIGRGDAFLLRIADKTGATVLSNDSFQEFHGEYEWLFEQGRLIGGKPVPGVGWIFTPRTPVRGPKSREAVKEAKRKRRPEPEEGSGLDIAAARGRDSGPRKGKKVAAAIATATEEAVATDGRRRRRRKSGEPPAEPVNEPLAFITFIAAHPLGSEVTGAVESFSSHGAFIDAEGARCYLPLSGMGEPPPRSAREVLAKGEAQTFVVQALDPLRRGIELAMPGFAHIAGAPTEETIEAEIAALAPIDAPAPSPSRRRRTAKPVAAEEGAGARGDEETPAAPSRPARKRATKAAPAPAEAVEEIPTAAAEIPTAPAPPTRRATGARKAAPAAPAVEPAAAPAAAPAKKAPARKAPARKAPSTTAAAEAATPVQKAPARKAAAKKAATEQAPAAPPAPAKKAPAKKAPAKKAAADKATAADKAAAAEKAVPAKKAPAKKVAPARKAVAADKAAAAEKAAPAKRASARKAAPVEEPPAAPPAMAGRRSPRRTAAATRDARGSTGRT